ncbi:hypothetical protein H1Q58_02285 [Planococcus maritimus]|uniref:Uncharacterized protein n=1 Tax=Planococcus maritimus TaxID=192421 RepID=A0A7D7REZ4_PLAMR|nr:hypothetical protein [Planococcus maritimus]QMT17880.1 hypothetical protein H1Q58_02285 [Planococcus maritimus]
MITKEEEAVFENELQKLTTECRECLDTSLKKKIEDDALWLQAIIFSTSGRKP